MVGRNVKVDVAVDAAADKCEQLVVILPGRVTVVAHRRIDAEIQAEARANVLQAHLHPAAADGVLKAAVEVFAQRIKPLIEAGPRGTRPAPPGPRTRR